MILLQRINKEQDAAAIAEKILIALNQPFIVCRHTISISACIGIAIFPQHGDEVSQLLKNADTAMYAAKHSGRNAFRFFDEAAAHAKGNSELL